MMIAKDESGVKKTANTRPNIRSKSSFTTRSNAHIKIATSDTKTRIKPDTVKTTTRSSSKVAINTKADAKTKASAETKINAETKTNYHPTPSRLSLGPKKPHHKTYCYNEHSLNRVLCQKLSERSISIKARDIYKDAGVTSPTFYYHYHNSNDARINYEHKLEQSFKHRMPTTTKDTYARSVFFLILTSFVKSNQIYFRAVAEGDDHHFLKQLLHSYRTILASSTISDHNYATYVAAIIAIINYWLLQDSNAPSATATYAERLSNVRVVRWW